MGGIDPTKLAFLDAIRTLLWWALVVAASLLGLYYKRKGSRSQGWRLYLGIYACIICQATYMTMWAVHNAAVRSSGYGPTTDTLYRICIPLYQLAMASFMVSRVVVRGPAQERGGAHAGLLAVLVMLCEWAAGGRVCPGVGARGGSSGSISGWRVPACLPLLCVCVCRLLCVCRACCWCWLQATRE